MGLIIAVWTIVILFLRFFITRGIRGGWNVHDVGQWFKFFLEGLTILIVAIP